MKETRLLFRVQWKQAELFRALTTFESLTTYDKPYFRRADWGWVASIISDVNSDVSDVSGWRQTASLYKLEDYKVVVRQT